VLEAQKLALAAERRTQEKPLTVRSATSLTRRSAVVRGGTWEEEGERRHQGTAGRRFN